MSNRAAPVQVFLCHSSGDKERVRELYRRLKADGFKPWLDEEDIVAGMEWEVETEGALRKSDVVVVCLSQSSITRAGFAQKEIKYALDIADQQPEGAIYIIPTKLEPCEVPSRLRRWHWVELYHERGYERLAAAIRKRAASLGSRSPEPAPRRPLPPVERAAPVELPPPPAPESRRALYLTVAFLWLVAAVLAVPLVLYFSMLINGGMARPDVVAPVSAGREVAGFDSSFKVFFGDLHSHTSYSDGSGTPHDAFRHARDVAKLDFLAVTEHNHSLAEAGASADRRDGRLIANDPSLYRGPRGYALIPAAESFTREGEFVALYGQEYSTVSSGNHVSVFDVRDVIPIRNGDFRALASWLDQQRDGDDSTPIVQFNHPSEFSDSTKEYGADDFGSRREWVRTMDRYVELIEVLSGPPLATGSGARPTAMESDFLLYLNAGFHVAPTSGQDTHYLTWGTATTARTAVLAPALTKKDILAALRDRFVYATEDPNLELIVSIQGHLAGEIVREEFAPGSLLEIVLSIRDPDEPDARYEVLVFSDDGPGGPVATQVARFTVRGNAGRDRPRRFNGVTYTGLEQYIFLKIQQTGSDGRRDRAWTAPVWFEPR